MKTKQKRIFTVVLAGFIAVSSASAQESQTKKLKLRGSLQAIDPQKEPQYEDVAWRRLQVELFGGWASLKPADLNLRAPYDTQYLANLKDYYSSYYPDTVQSSPSGDFKSVESSFPMGIRVRYRASRLLSFSLGLKYFSKNQTSEVSAEFQASGRRPHNLRYAYTNYSISSKAWIPILGVHLSIGQLEPVNFEYFLSGGPMFAECGYRIETEQVYSRYGNVYRMYETDYDAAGDSIGLSLETGLRINLEIKGGLMAFCEGGYAYQKAKNLEGPGNFVHYYYRDANTKEVSDNLYWEGYWGVKETEEFPPLPSNEWEKDDERVREFSLDLSGVFFRVGISFQFSL
ncbi:MAG: hypothetical protein PVI66_01335 [Candidatus Aminicenantes bacterium]|jgi:hypothetical protein